MLLPFYRGLHLPLCKGDRPSRNSRTDSSPQGRIHRTKAKGVLGKAPQTHQGKAHLPLLPPSWPHLPADQSLPPLQEGPDGSRRGRATQEPGKLDHSCCRPTGQTASTGSVAVASPVFPLFGLRTKYALNRSSGMLAPPPPSPLGAPAPASHHQHPHTPACLWVAGCQAGVCSHRGCSSFLSADVVHSVNMYLLTVDYMRGSAQGKIACARPSLPPRVLGLVWEVVVSTKR